MSNYTPTFNKPYPGGWKDKPIKTTPWTASIQNSYENTIVNVEQYLQNNPIVPGTNVVANPTLAGSETNLTALQVGNTKYKVEGGGAEIEYGTEADFEEVKDSLPVGASYLVTDDGSGEPSSGGGGTTVIANPTLVGTEDDLTGLQVGNTKYKVPSGGSDTTDYEDLTNKPSINGTELIGDVTIDIPTELADLTDDSTHRVVTDTEKATWNGKQDVLTAGSNITISGNVISATDSGDIVEVTPIQTTGTHIADIEVNGVTSEIYAPNGGSGTTDYEDLTNKPQINGVTLDGDMSTSDLDLAEVVELTKAQYDALPDTKLSDDKNYLVNDWTEQDPVDVESIISDAWESSKTYNVGDYCIYSDKLYKCLIQHTSGTITPLDTTYWEATSVSEELSKYEEKWDVLNSTTYSLETANVERVVTIPNLSKYSEICVLANAGDGMGRVTASIKRPPNGMAYYDICNVGEDGNWRAFMHIAVNFSSNTIGIIGYTANWALTICNFSSVWGVKLA